MSLNTSLFKHFVYVFIIIIKLRWIKKKILKKIIMRLHEKEVDTSVDWLMLLVWYHCEFYCKKDVFNIIIMLIWWSLRINGEFFPT